MQKIIYTVAIVFVFSSSFSQAKDKQRFEIKTNILNLVAAGPSAGLEYSLKNNFSIMISLASGHIDYGDFGGVTRYRTATVEYRKYLDHVLFVGTYLKNIVKQVSWQESISGSTIPFSIGHNRDFTGNGLSGGLTTGVKFYLSNTLRLELNSQLGFGHYYRMTDKYNNLPSGSYLDTRIGIWLGFRL